MAKRLLGKLRLNSLAVRLTIVCTVVTLLMLILSFSLSFIGMRDSVKQFSRNQFASVADGLGKQLAAYYEQRGEWAGVSVLLQDDIPFSWTAVVVTDAEGRVVYDSSEPGMGQALSPDTLADMRPVDVGEQRVGYWSVDDWSTPQFDAQEQMLLEGVERLLIFVALLATGVGLVVSVTLTTSLTRPLQRLVTASQSVADGDLDHRVEEQGSDEVVQVARAFNEMTAALTQAEDLRQNLMADIAHELRTPLSVIQGNLRAILDDVYPLEKQEIARLYDETRLLSRLVDDLRELALADAGQLRLNVRETDLARLLNLTTDNFQPAAESKQIDLALDIAASLPPVQADPDRLAQVLRNLLTNALRHTPGGGQIAVRADLDGERIRVSVTDSGPGIAPESLDRILDRFWRSDPSRSREYGGSGLGLAIAKSLVEAHGGRIWAESEPGRGATFCFELVI